MYSLRSVDVLSCAKIMAAVHGCMSLVFIPFFLLFGFAGLVFGRSSGVFAGIGAIVLALVLMIVLPLFYAALGFLMGALGAWLYNLAARHIGGIRFEVVAPVVATPPAPGIP